MYVSEYNVFVELDEHPELAIIQNIFHGHATIVPQSLATYLKSAAESGDLSALPEDIISSLRQKGFIYSSKENEDEQIETIYSESKKTLPEANPSRQYQIILTYECNLCCTYCFQNKIRNKKNHALMSEEQLSKIFAIILSKERTNDKETKQKELPARAPLISIVGGEPLLDTPKSMERVADVIDFAKQNGFHYAITTNGVFLDKYIPVFRAAGYNPTGIQVTIDGTKEYHDRRRINIKGSSSFEQIAQSIECVLAAGMCISLRINLDEMNISSINRLADYVHERQWTSYNGFSAYLAPVTDHSSINNHYDWLKQDTSLIKRILEIFRKRPELENVFSMKNFRGFQYIKRIAQKEGKAVPAIWRCEAVLGQLIFDPQGDLYTCFEGAGNEKAKIGTYSPSYIIDEQQEKMWKDLNAIDNKYCRRCSNRFVCSSGCPWHIVSQEATECLPIKEEIKLAWNYYASRVLGAMEGTFPSQGNRDSVT